MSSGAVKPGSQGLGWFLRRTRTPGTLAHFYQSGLGLPCLRSWDTPQTAGDMLWCGDVGVFELNRLDPNTPLEPQRSPCLPVFGSLDVEISSYRALEAGAKPIHGAFPDRFDIRGFTDPDGFLFGIEQMEAERTGSLAPHDKSWPGGISNLPGGVSIDGPIQCISRVIHKTVNPPAECEFLSQLGFSATSPDTISLGGVTEIVLEQDISSEMPAPLENREMSLDTWIARVYDLETFRAALRSCEGKLLSSHEFAGGVLDYTLSPNNILIGWQERKPYDPDIPTTQMIEDLAARTLWINKAKAKAV